MNELSDLMKGIGAMAEISKLHYDNCIRVGFSGREALALTQTFLQTQMMMATGQSKAEEGGAE